MDATSSTLFAELPKLLCLFVALVGALFAFNAWRRHHRSSAVAGTQRSTPQNGGKIVYHDTPTIRVVDSQRVDRIRKIVRLKQDEFVDILERRGSPVPRFRVTLKEIIYGAADSPSVRIAVEYGGTTLSCGPLVNELGHHEFIVPRAVRDDHRSCVLHFHERGNALDFMRIKLRNVDAATHTAEIDVMQVSGSWPAT